MEKYEAVTSNVVDFRNTSTRTPWTTVRTALTILLLLLNYFISQYDKFVLAYFQREVIQALHLTTTQYGLLSGYSTGIVSALAAIPVTFIADYSRARLWTLFVAALWWNICVLLQGYTHKFWQIFLARLAMSIGQAPVEALSVSLISDLVPSRWLFLSESILYVGVYIGEAVSAQIATAFAATNTPWNDALKGIGVAGLVLALCLRTVAREPERKNLIKTSEPISSHTSPPREEANIAAHRSASSAFVLLRDSVRHVMRMKSFWILTLAGGARQFSGNVFGTYMPSYLSSIYPHRPDLLSHYGIVVGVVGSVAVLIGGLICSTTPHVPLMALYLTGVGGMISGPFVVCMVFSLQLAGPYGANTGLRILYGTMSAAYMTAELWLGAFASLLASLLPPEMKTFCLSIYTCTIILIYSSAPQIIGLALRSYDTQSPAYIRATRNILAILIPVGYWVAGLGFLVGAVKVKHDIAVRRGQAAERNDDVTYTPLSKWRVAAFAVFLSILVSLTIALLVTSLVVN